MIGTPTIIVNVWQLNAAVCRCRITGAPVRHLQRQARVRGNIHKCVRLFAFALRQIDPDARQSQLIASRTNSAVRMFLIRNSLLSHCASSLALQNIKPMEDGHYRTRTHLELSSPNCFAQDTDSQPENPSFRVTPPAYQHNPPSLGPYPSIVASDPAIAPVISPIFYPQTTDISGNHGGEYSKASDF